MTQRERERQEQWEAARAATVFSVLRGKKKPRKELPAWDLWWRGINSSVREKEGEEEKQAEGLISIEAKEKERSGSMDLTLTREQGEKGSIMRARARREEQQEAGQDIHGTSARGLQTDRLAHNTRDPHSLLPSLSPHKLTNTQEHTSTTTIAQQNKMKNITQNRNNGNGLISAADMHDAEAILRRMDAEVNNSYGHSSSITQRNMAERGGENKQRASKSKDKKKEPLNLSQLRLDMLTVAKKVEKRRKIIQEKKAAMKKVRKEKAEMERKHALGNLFSSASLSSSLSGSLSDQRTIEERRAERDKKTAALYKRLQTERWKKIEKLRKKKLRLFKR